MQKVVKWLFLFLTVGLPVVTYVFLQGFGENRFDIPVFYEKEGIPQLSDCNSKTYPYYVGLNETALVSCMSPSSEIVANVLVIVDSLTENDQIFVNNLESLVARVDNHAEYNLVTFAADSLKNEILGDFGAENNCIAFGRKEEVRDVARCLLFLGDSSDSTEYVLNRDIVLLDKEYRIRGYYNALLIEDVDRLVTELKILIKND